MDIRPSVVKGVCSTVRVEEGAACVSANADARAAFVTEAFDADLRSDLCANLFGVAHYAHFSTLSGFEGGEGVEYKVERFLVEVAKSLVDEEASDVEGAARERGESECQGKGDNKGFAAREGVDKSAFVEHVVVDDFEGEGALDDIELIARRELGEMLIGVLDEEGEREGLCQVSESFAVGRSEEFLESAPLLGVVVRFEELAVVVGCGKQALFVSLYAAALFAHGFALSVEQLVELSALCHEDVDVHLRCVRLGLPARDSAARRALCFARRAIGRRGVS